jgi:hypothetical protein
MILVMESDMVNNEFCLDSKPPTTEASGTDGMFLGKLLQDFWVSGRDFLLVSRDGEF